MPSFAAVALMLALAATAAAPAADPADAQQTWWENLRRHCGKAYAGTLSHGDPSDEAIAKQRLVMHVRECDEKVVEIPFHVGENRSRTWVLTRTPGGIELKHDHRHEDGTPDAVTMYGGHTDSPGTQAVQSFPADEHSKKLFVEHGLPASTANVWSMEIVPGERFAYALRRPGRHFRVEFDLTKPVEPPPAAWGKE